MRGIGGREVWGADVRGGRETLSGQEGSYKGVLDGLMVSKMGRSNSTWREGGKKKGDVEEKVGGGGSSKDWFEKGLNFEEDFFFNGVKVGL